MKDIISQSILLATTAHAGQVRKGSGLPYIIHPLEVMGILIRHEVVDPEILAAAVLHDTVEDCNLPLEDISVVISPKTAEIVSHLSKPPGLTKEEQRKWALKSLKNGPPGARIVKMADRLSNISSLWQVKWSKRHKDAYLEEALEIAKIGADANSGLSHELRHRAMMEQGWVE